MNIFKIRKEYFIQKSELANEKIKNEKQEKKIIILEERLNKIAAEKLKLEAEICSLLEQTKQLKEEVAILLIKKRKVAASKGGLQKELNKIRKNQSEEKAKFNKIVKELVAENKKLKNPTTIKKLKKYERR